MKFLYIIAFVCFATSLFTRAIDPVVPQIALDLGLKPSTVALLATAYALPYAAIQPVLGALADMMSKTRLMMTCMAVLVASAGVSALTTNFELLMATRMISGIASGGVFPIALAIVGDRVPVAQRQVALGRLVGAAMIGNLMGATGAGILGDLFGWRSVFIATAFIGMIVCAAAWRALSKEPEKPSAGFDLATLRTNYRAIFGNPLAKYCFVAVMFEAIFVFGLFPHVAALIVAGGESRASIAGFVIAGFGIGAISYTMTVSRLLTWFSTRQLMAFGGLGIALCLSVIAMRIPWPVEMAMFFLMGFAMYCLHGCIQIIATELAPSARGSALAIHSLFFFLGQAIGPVYYGVAFANLGIAPPFFIAALFITVTGLVCAQRLGVRTRQPRPR